MGDATQIEESKPVGILAIQHGAPPRVQTAEELAPLIDKEAHWIREHAGVERRYISGTDEDPARLAAELACPIIEQYGPPDLILNASALGRQLIPDMSAFIARELGLSGIPGFSVNATCLSFLVALRTATALIAGGPYRRVLICSSEFATHGRDFRQPESASLLGDGAAVALVGHSGGRGQLLRFEMETWPEGADLAEVRGLGILRSPNDQRTTLEDNLFQMQGDRMLRCIVPKLGRFVPRFLSNSGLTRDDINVVVPHQTSAAGIKVLQRLGFPEHKVVNILPDYGNCVAASIPMALSKADATGRIKRGDLVLLLGTAAGLSIGAALIRW